MPGSEINLSNADLGEFDSESLPSNSGLGDLPWLCMVTLFIASIITLILYLVQYFYSDLRIQMPEQNNAGSGEADVLLGWALSLNSWKSQWRGAWCRALNDESTKSGVSLTTVCTTYMWYICFHYWALQVSLFLKPPWNFQITCSWCYSGFNIFLSFLCFL